MGKLHVTDTEEEIEAAAQADHHQNHFEETVNSDGVAEEKKPVFPSKQFKNDAGVIFNRNFSERVWLIFEDPSTSLMGKWMSLVMMLLIVISCVGFVMATVPHFT